MSRINDGLYSSNFIAWDVDKNGCWISTTHHSVNGYPRISISGKTVKLHRYLFQVFKEKIPKGKILRHTCDNPWCVSPHHLLIGTYAENSADMVERNRQAKGERQGSAKLTIGQVREIKSSDLSCRKLASLYGVSKGHISKIKSGEKWRHVS
jgi:hypothetical protein